MQHYVRMVKFQGKWKKLKWILEHHPKAMSITPLPWCSRNVCNVCGKDSWEIPSVLTAREHWNLGLCEETTSKTATHFLQRNLSLSSEELLSFLGSPGHTWRLTTLCFYVEIVSCDLNKEKKRCNEELNFPDGVCLIIFYCVCPVFLFKTSCNPNLNTFLGLLYNTETYGTVSQWTFSPGNDYFPTKLFFLYDQQEKAWSCTDNLLSVRRGCLLSSLTTILPFSSPPSTSSLYINEIDLWNTETVCNLFDWWLCYLYCPSGKYTCSI